uniref:transposase n=1 Tax=Enterocloster clostridioformis TaxID=1531 RepID=UPI0025A688C0|nr:transposase [Enterocloster clostridioformis]
MYNGEKRNRGLEMLRNNSQMCLPLSPYQGLYDLSDERLLSSAQTELAYKYFLDLEPESPLIDPSLLTKFRKTRITEDILEDMLKKTIR